MVFASLHFGYGYGWAVECAVFSASPFNRQSFSASEAGRVSPYLISQEEEEMVEYLSS